MFLICLLLKVVKWGILKMCFFIISEVFGKEEMGLEVGVFEELSDGDVLLDLLVMFW